MDNTKKLSLMGVTKEFSIVKVLITRYGNNSENSKGVTEQQYIAITISTIIEILTRKK
jgi:hypothetical protein